MSDIFILLLIGIIAGIISGMIGIGGGIVIIPMLIFILGFSQHKAQGTTLALMVPPIGILAAIEYYKKGHVDIKAAALICAGFFIGGLIGAKIANFTEAKTLAKIFALILIATGIKMLFTK